MDEQRNEFDFYVWHLGGYKSAWISGKVKAKSALDALNASLSDCDYVGLYFVCDPGYNPGSDRYGDTQFWVDEHKNIRIVHHIGLKTKTHDAIIEIETIEI